MGSKSWAVPNADEDNWVQYILNDKVLKQDFEDELFLINDETFKELIDQKTLQQKYRVDNKSAGVLIATDSLTKKQIH